MKKLLATLVAVATLATAGAAAAQDYRRGRDEWRGDRRGGDVITIRDHGRVYTFDENDRMFYRLLESPYGMRPGNVYVYTDECRRDQCQVIIYSRYRRESQGRLWAPPLHRARWDDRRWDDDRWDDDHRRRGRNDVEDILREPFRR
jgi:Ni/Co efflux regulator RcnB